MSIPDLLARERARERRCPDCMGLMYEASDGVWECPASGELWHNMDAEDARIHLPRKSDRVRRPWNQWPEGFYDDMGG